MRINAPELNTDAGKFAKMALEVYLKGKTLIAQTQTSDNFGRFLAEVWVDGSNLSDWLVQNGYAQYKAY